MNYENKQEIPFGAFGSELIRQEISIPDGFEAVIEGNKIILKKIESEDERIRKKLITFFQRFPYTNLYDEGLNAKDVLAWLEKQGEQEQLYIRFGEIPTDEKSKIFRGEIEVGTENGVSVYPAFKTSEGDIVLGLNLPITKTTLYTQQHLIEYDDRPCYLVKGDYVGKDTDGQPLINNVSIIEKIDTYRVKEKKQGEQKLAWSEEDINKPNGGIVMEDFNDGNGFYKVNLAYLNEEQVKQIEELVKRWDLQPKGNEDESIISDLLDYFDEDKCLKHEVNDIVKWLKTIKPQQKGWSDNEIKMFDNLITYLDGRKGLLEEIKRTYIDWLKSIKSRVKPKQEWSEEDEIGLGDALWAIKQARTVAKDENDMGNLWYAENWLKSIKSRISLKQEWSEEEIEKAAQEWESKAIFNPFYMTMDGDKPTGVKQDITTHKESFKAGVEWILKKNWFLVV